MKKSILATAIVSLYAPALFAQDTDSTKVDETIVVTANRFEQTQSSTLATMSVIDRSQIEAIQADTALDVLQTLPGVEIVKQGTKGNTSSIFLRGTSTAQTLVLVDGVKVNSPAAGGATIGLIPAFAIEKIEVIRGPRASIYGADAVGGVISITTVPSSGESVHELSLTGGSDYYNSEGFRSVGKLSDKTQGSFVVNNEGSKGYNISTSVPEDENYGYDSQVLFGSLSHKITNNWIASFNGYKQSSSNEFQRFASKNETEQDFYTVAGKIDYSQDSFQTNVQISQTHDELATRDAAKTNPQAILTAKRTSVSWLNSYSPTSNVTLNAGVDYYQENADRGGSNTTNYEETKRHNTGVFATSLVKINPVILELSIRNDDDSSYGNNTTWGVAAGVNVTDSMILSASHGTAFRAPTFNDLYWPSSPSDQGNPDLKPEASASSEVSLQGFHTFASWSISAYQTEIEDLIEWAPIDPNDLMSKWTPSNVSEAEIKGIELAVEFDTGIVHHTVSADWKDPKNKTNGAQLMNRAKQNYSWIGSLQWEDFQSSLVANYVGERPDSSTTSQNMMDAYFTVDLALKYDMTENLTTRFKVSNLFDEDYETSADQSGGYFIGPERSYYAGIDYRF
ncbi:TonB-dependent receptor [Vibrio breoganii]|uniref:TonB-dependent receptor domain-containing protein n=1 Tax=Vibrio breoganii TaxID=553239 RepID=UPI0010BE0780|nr:TonB-dependent receptor [Vibrio breoganii]TKG28587.1 TonB-dependent receptor [Vibrio breoganii]